MKIGERTIAELVSLTGPRGSEPGFTYSDLSQRLVPAAVMAAFPDRPLTADILVRVAKGMSATPEFRPQP
jgi:hypothetical protein